MTQAPSPTLMPVEEALARVLALAPVLSDEAVPLAEAAGRYLSAPLAAKRDQPPFAASAMDGYALPERPRLGARYRVIGEAAAGHAFDGTLSGQQAVRISTGAPVPKGALQVIMQENVTREADEITITALDSSPNIRAQGQDFRAGATLAPRRLRPVDLALVAAMNVARPMCWRRPKVAIISTGDELVWPGESPRADQIILSNAFAIKAICEREGAEVTLLPIAADTPPALRAAFEAARGADVIVTSGGASVGDHDLVAPIATELGLRAEFWKIALRPGKPLMAGALFGAAFLGLPGNPVSATVCAELFLAPLLRQMQGDPTPAPRLQTARLAEDIPANGPRSHYMRAECDAQGQIRPYVAQDSALLRVLSEANALLVRPPHDPPRAQGALVSYIAL